MPTRIQPNAVKIGRLGPEYAAREVDGIAVHIEGAVDCVHAPHFPRAEVDAGRVERERHRGRPRRAGPERRLAPRVALGLVVAPAATFNRDCPLCAPPRLRWLVIQAVGRAVQRGRGLRVAGHLREEGQRDGHDGRGCRRCRRLWERAPRILAPHGFGRVEVEQAARRSRRVGGVAAVRRGAHDTHPARDCHHGPVERAREALRCLGVKDGKVAVTVPADMNRS